MSEKPYWETLKESKTLLIVKKSQFEAKTKPAIKSACTVNVNTEDICVHLEEAVPRTVVIPYVYITKPKIVDSFKDKGYSGDVHYPGHGGFWFRVTVPKQFYSKFISTVVRTGMSARGAESTNPYKPVVITTERENPSQQYGVSTVVPVPVPVQPQYPQYPQYPQQYMPPSRPDMAQYQPIQYPSIEVPQAQAQPMQPQPEMNYEQASPYAMATENAMQSTQQPLPGQQMGQNPAPGLDEVHYITGNAVPENTYSNPYVNNYVSNPYQLPQNTTSETTQQFNYYNPN